MTRYRNRLSALLVLLALCATSAILLPGCGGDSPIDPAIGSSSSNDSVSTDEGSTDSTGQPADSSSAGAASADPGATEAASTGDGSSTGEQAAGGVPSDSMFQGSPALLSGSGPGAAEPGFVFPGVSGTAAHNGSYTGSTGTADGPSDGTPSATPLLRAEISKDVYLDGPRAGEGNGAGGSGGSDGSGGSRSAGGGSTSGRLALSGPQDVTPAAARTMLQQTGLMSAGGSMSDALARMKTGFNQGGTVTDGSLDSTARRQLYQMYDWYWKARQAYPYPNITLDSPQARGWIAGAAAQMQNVPEEARVPLLRATMVHESQGVHWTNFVPTMGQTADTGFGQALPAKALSFGFNPYDPARNIFGLARALDTAYATQGNLHDSLARYNGGPGWQGAKPQQYANAILNTLPARYRRM